LVFLNFSASEVRERDYFYGPAFYFFAVFIGIGAAWLLASIAERVRGRGKEAFSCVVPAGALIVILSILPARHNWFTHDRSNNYLAQDYAYNMLAGLEPDAIIFTNGDNDTYPLWYLQQVERFRTDVRVANLSLLNTDWYLRQLRDRDPRAPLSLTDGEIARMRPIALKGGGIAWKRDQAVQRIVTESNWKRPIYFAVTVPLEIWQPYARHLEMQGIARRLVPVEGEDRINEYLLARNLDEIYRFRGILTADGAIDTSVYKDDDTRVMFVNFAVAAAQLGQQRAIAGDYEEAIRRMELSLAFDPTLKAATVLLGTYYMMAGRDGDAIAHYLRAIRGEPDEGEYWMRLARIYEFKDQLPFAIQNLNEGLRLAPDHRQLYIDAFRVSARMGQGDRAKGYIRQWLERHPDDAEMASVLRGADRLLEEEFGLGGGAAPRGGDDE
jgi:tetratricopeptide (TPR) repeat protein